MVLRLWGQRALSRSDEPVKPGFIIPRQQPEIRAAFNNRNKPHTVKDAGNHDGPGDFRRRQIAHRLTNPAKKLFLVTGPRFDLTRHIVLRNRVLMRHISDGPVRQLLPGRNRAGAALKPHPQVPHDLGMRAPVIQKRCGEEDLTLAVDVPQRSRSVKNSIPIRHISYPAPCIYPSPRIPPHILNNNNAKSNPPPCFANFSVTRRQILVTSLSLSTNHYKGNVTRNRLKKNEATVIKIFATLLHCHGHIQARFRKM